MKKTHRSLLTTLLTALALAAATFSLSWLPDTGAASSIEAPVEVAQSTSAILEDKSA